MLIIIRIIVFKSCKITGVNKMIPIVSRSERVPNSTTDEIQQIPSHSIPVG